MATKRSFQPPRVEDIQPLAGSEKIPKFPKPTFGSATRAESSPSPAASDESPASTALTSSQFTALDSSRVEQEVRLINLALIRKSKFQNRTKIDENYVADLADNIRADRLNNPILVRPIEDGLFEILAGEHRYEAFKLNGDPDVPAIVKVLDDKQAARLLVFDNVYHRSPTDYELYRGFRLLLEIEAVPSIRALAKDASLSHTQLNRIMSFGKLPEAAREILDAAPSLIGASVADALAKYAGGGYDELIIEVLQKIRSGELTQLRAAAWIEHRLTNTALRTTRVLTYAQGKPFCTLVRDGASIKIKVAPGIDASSLEDAIYSALKDRAEAAKDEGVPS